MQTFSAVLKRLMDMNHYTTYQLAQLSGVNRTTIQRSLTSGRCPQKEAFLKLAANLNLTGREWEQFFESYERAVIGDYIYNRRQYVKQLLEKADMVLPVLSEPLRLEQHVHLPEYFKKKMLYGAFEIGQLLKVLLHQEIYHQETPEVCLAFPPESQLFSRLLTDIDEKGIADLTLKQLIYLVRNPSVPETDSHYNLHVLNCLLPLALLKTEGYHIYCAYSNCIISEEFSNGFPYYILFTDCALLLSGDLNTAVLETSPQMVDYLLREFNSETARCQELISSVSVKDELQIMLQRYAKSTTLHSIEYQPCFLSYLDEELLRNITNRQFPHMEEIIETFLLFIRRFYEFKEIVHIFNENSLEDFITNGEIMMVPREAARPLTPQERLTMMNRLYDCCKEENQMIRIINPTALPLSRFFGISVYGNKNVELSLYNEADNWFHCIMIDETTLFEAFTDFITYAVQSPMVYSQERTLQIIDGYRIRLRCRLEEQI